MFRLISAIAAFLYPAYSSYKTLSKKPTNDVELERWTMYWCVLGGLLAIEQVFPLIAWIPFYSLIRMIFLLYLVLPQIQGSTYIYKIHLHPFLLEHEGEIDTLLERYKAKLWEEGTRWGKVLWAKITESIGASGQSSAAAAAGTGAPGVVPPAGPTAGAAPPPTLTSPLAGTAQMLGGMWKAYGPTLIATGASFLDRHSATPPAFPSAQAAAPHPSLLTPGSVLTRRRQLEAELAALNSGGYDAGGPSSSSSATPPAFPVPQPHPVGTPTGSSSEDEKRYEDISREEATPPSPNRPASWFSGWGSPAAKGYEKVKND